MNTPEIVEEFDEDTQDEQPFLVDSLQEFIPIYQDWHSKQVKTVEHFLTVPEGQITETEGEPELVLEGDVLRGFKMGLSIALHYLGTLPFHPVIEEMEPQVH